MVMWIARLERRLAHWRFKAPMVHSLWSSLCQLNDCAPIGATSASKTSMNNNKTVPRRRGASLQVCQTRSRDFAGDWFNFAFAIFVLFPPPSRTIGRRFANKFEMTIVCGSLCVLNLRVLFSAKRNRGCWRRMTSSSDKINASIAFI